MPRRWGLRIARKFTEPRRWLGVAQKTQHWSLHSFDTGWGVGAFVPPHRAVASNGSLERPPPGADSLKEEVARMAKPGLWVRQRPCSAHSGLGALSLVHMLAKKTS